jgi:hypothetical protein
MPNEMKDVFRHTNEVESSHCHNYELNIIWQLASTWKSRIKQRRVRVTARCRPRDRDSSLFLAAMPRSKRAKLGPSVQPPVDRMSGWVLNQVV